MGNTPTPSDTAPSYEELYHPIDHASASSSSAAAPGSHAMAHLSSLYNNLVGNVRTYTPLMAEDDGPEEEEMRAHVHVHGGSQLPLQTYPDPSGQKPHLHCETCDAQYDRLAARRWDDYCCRMTAAVFMMALIMAMIVLVVFLRR